MPKWAQVGNLNRPGHAVAAPGPAVGTVLEAAVVAALFACRGVPASVLKSMNQRLTGLDIERSAELAKGTLRSW